MHRPFSHLAGLLLLGSCTPVAEPEPLSAPPAPFSTALLSAPGVTRIDLGTLGGPSSYATDVNDAGVVVGWSERPDGSRMAFRWTRAGGMQQLPFLAGFTESMATTITPHGDILGHAWSVSGAPQANVVWWAAGGVTRLEIPRLPGTLSSVAVDRNDAGEVVGYSTHPSAPFRAWYWSPSQGIHSITEDIPFAIESYVSAINRSGLVVGAAEISPRGGVHRVFLWSRQRGYHPIGLAGEDPTREEQGAGGMNDSGVVVGTFDPHGLGIPVPFVWRRSTGFTKLPKFPSSWDYAYATSVNLGGTVVGASANGEYGVIQSAAWPRGGGIINLNGADPHASVALAINRAGLAAGWSSLLPQGGLNHATAWIIAPGTVGLTPEPDTAGTSRGPGSPPHAMNGIEGCLARVARIPTREALLDCVSHPTDRRNPARPVPAN